MKLSKLLAFAGGVSVIALGTVAVMQIRHEMEKTRESVRQMVREAAAEAGREAGKEVRAGLIEGMDHVADRVEQMPAQVFQSTTDELQRRFTGFAEGVGGGNELPGTVLENVLDIVTGPAQTSQSSQTETPVPIPQGENLLGDFADLPEPPNASVDDQASSGSPSRASSASVPGELDQILERYVPSNGNQPLQTIDRILDDPGIHVTGLLDGILAHTRRSYNPDEGI
jgi:hypothetical protein